jgi:hypothetical protein
MTAYLNDEEQAKINAASEGLVTLRKTLEVWFKTIAPGYAALKPHADNLNYRRAFQDLQVQNGLIIGRDEKTGIAKLLDKAEVSRMLDVYERLEEVEKWREGLTAKQRWTWQSPSSVHRHCGLFPKKPNDGAPRKPTVKEVTEELAKALEENHKLKAQLQDNTDRYRPNSPAKLIARIWFETLPRNKLKEAIAEAERLMRETPPPPFKPSLAATHVRPSHGLDVWIIVATSRR